MRGALAALLALAMGALTVVSLVATNAAAATVPLAVVLDDRAAGTVQALRQGAILAVPLLPLAAALGWTLDRSEGGWRLRGDGRTFLLRPGSVQVTERGSLALTLLHAPLELDRRLFVATGDLPGLFDVRADVQGRRLAVSTTTIDAGVAVSEQKKPPKKKAVATPSPSPTPLVRGFQGGDRVTLTLVQNGPSRTVGVALQTVGTIRSGLAMTDDGVPTTGSVTLGTADRNVTVGDTSDPLIGLVFRNPGLIGAEVRSGRYAVVTGRRTRDGRTVTGFSATHGSRTDFVELLRSPGGRFDQAIVGRRVSRVTSWGLLREEVFAGTKGVGLGAYARTRGRFYGELTATAASGGFPLQAGDAPIIADAAYDMSRGLTARLGFSGGHGTPSSPFAGFVAHGAHLGGALTVARGYTGVSGSYAGAGANAQFSLSRSAGLMEYGVRAAGTVRGVALELNANADTQSDHDVSLLARRVGRGIDLLAGVEAGRSSSVSWAAPVVGVAVPLVRGLDLEATISPQGSARPVIRISLVAGFTPPHRTARIVTVPLIVRVDSALPQAVVLYVDGFRTKEGDGTGVRIDVVPGAHFVRLETLDGALGSPDTPVDTAATREAALPLWPLRAISGRILVDAPASTIPRDLSLAGISLVLDPGGVVTTADAEGRFAFPLAAIAPNATVHIDEDTAPSGLAPLAAAPVGEAGVVTLKLGPARKVERVTFPSSGQ
ncbi:MAG: hypothetical protein JWO85_104 [Candidatus Eremiobacteraeota bacterium]|nr:hypothetical protein [Candidatus Eremiobacteraeota bacterium]